MAKPTPENPLGLNTGIFEGRFDYRPYLEKERQNYQKKKEAADLKRSRSLSFNYQDPGAFFGGEQYTDTLAQFGSQYQKDQKKVDSLKERKLGVQSLKDDEVRVKLYKYGLNITDNEEENKQTLSNFLDSEINKKLKQQTRTQKLARDLMGENFSYQEGVLGGQLNEQEQALNKYLNERLGTAIQETEQQAGQLRAQTGEVANAQGLGRSTFAQREIENVTAAEQAQKAQVRLSTSQASEAMRNFKENTLDAIKQKRQALELGYALKDLQTAEDLQFNFDANALQANIDQEVLKIKDSANSGFLGGILGGLAGGIAGFFAGGPVGAVAGAGVGYNLGAGVEQAI